jgi:hypothetical protein
MGSGKSRLKTACCFYGDILTTPGLSHVPPGTGEYSWDTWHTNISFNLLAFIKNFLYLFPGPRCISNAISLAVG